MKRKILYLHSSDELYGSDLSLYQLVSGLDRDVFESIIILPEDIKYENYLSDLFFDNQFRYIKYDLAILRRDYFSIRGLIKYIQKLILSIIYLTSIVRKENIDLIHSNSISIIPGAIVSIITHVPHIWHIREIIVEPKILWRITSCLVSLFSTLVIVNSNNTGKHLSKGFKINPDKIITVYNGIDLNEFDTKSVDGRIRDEWKIGRNNILIGMIGRVSSWKGQDYFLDVARYIHELREDVRFVIVGGPIHGGESYYKSIQRLVAKYNLQDVVLMPGFRKDVPMILGSLNIFVHPSTRPEPFGRVIIEAMAMELPVVATAHGGCREIILDGITGVLTPPGNPLKMAEEILSLIENNDIARTMGENGRKRVEQLFSNDRYVSSVVDVYNRVLSKIK